LRQHLGLRHVAREAFLHFRGKALMTILASAPRSRLSVNQFVEHGERKAFDLSLPCGAIDRVAEGKQCEGELRLGFEPPHGEGYAKASGLDSSRLGTAQNNALPGRAPRRATEPPRVFWPL
jgi:hypothetical protein